jgi:GNAT superfamily N-acetyltransferase
MSTAIDNTRGLPAVLPLAEGDLPEAERFFRVAFGTFLGVPDPETFWADRDYVYGRWRAPHVTALGATLDGLLLGSNFATKWGSVGFFGPITVRPDLQERGIAQALLRATVDQFDAWGTTQNGLFTFAAVRATPSADKAFARLLDAAEALALSSGMPNLMAGANLARQEAYQQMVARGFRTAIQGVYMHRHNEPGYCRPGVYIIDDWR